MNFKDKRIMVVCKETYSYPLHFLVKKWLANNEVAAFFFNPCETKYSKCTLNEITYYAYKDIPGLKLYTSDVIADEFTSMLQSNEICDEKLLSMIERDYSHFQNVNNQIMSTQFLTRHYHYRNYMHSCSYVQQLNWVILNYKNIIDIINDFKPDVVLDTDNAELARTILREVCFSQNIPYINIEHPRYEFYKLYSYNLNLKYTEIFKQTYDRLFLDSDIRLSKGLEYVDEFRKKTSIMHAMYKGDVTAQYTPDSILCSFRKVLGMAKYFLKQDMAGNNRSIKKANPLIYPNSKEYILFYFNFEMKKQKLLRKNKYFSAPEDVKYVYMPLHLIPESTTFSVSPMYVNELTIIEAVSKCLPAGWWLYVKEHQAMVGERGVEFYEKANKLPNVKMVQLNYYQDPKPWISKAQGVVTISGTSAYEASLMGKRSIVFADTPFSLIEGVTRIRSFEELPNALKDFSKPLNNRRSCAAYIEAVKELGYHIDLKLLLNKGERILRGQESMNQEYQENLNNLERLFEDGYDEYKK